MKNSFLCLVCVLILFHIALPGFSQAVWKQYNGPFSGEISSLASYQGSLYIGSPLTGIFKSNDGKTWTPTIPSLTYTYSLFNDGTSLLIGNHNLLSYTDSTSDLVQLGQEIPGYIEYIHRMNGKLFVCTSESIYRYDPVANLLVEKNNGIPLIETIRWTRNLVSIDGVLFCNTLPSGIYKSLDNGDHWEKVNVLNQSRGFNAMKTHGDSLVCVADWNVYLSTDKGQSWENINNNIPISANTNLVIRNDQLFVTTVKGVFSLKNGSKNWEKVDDGLYFSIMLANEKMFTSDAGGLYRWNSVSNKFIPSNKGINTSRVTDIEEFSSKIYAGTQAGLHFTTPGSDNWQVVPELRSQHILTVVKSKSKLWIASSQGLYAASSSSTPVFNKVGGLPSGYIMDIEVVNNRIYAATENDVYVSYNEGVTWKILRNTVMKAPDSYIKFISANDNMLLVANTKGLCKILPDSSDWVKINFFTTQMFSLNIMNGIIYASEMNRGIYRSHDYGVTWELSKIPGYNRMDMIKRGNNIYAATYNKVYYSSDNGDSWDPFYETGIPDVMLNCIAEGRNNFYIGTYGKSMWSRPFLPKNSIQSDIHRIANDTIYGVDPAITLEEFQKNVSVSYGASIEFEIINVGGRTSENYTGVNRIKIIAEDGINKKILNVYGAPGGPAEPDEPVEPEQPILEEEPFNPDDPDEPNEPEEVVTSVFETELKTEIYPLPAHDRLFITSPELLGSWQIINAMGQKLPQQELSNGYIDVSQLPRGIYFLVVSDKSGRPQRLKFLKD